MTTHDPTPPTCECPPLAEHLRGVLEGHDTPPCPVHHVPTPDPSSTVALNDNAALAAAIGAELHTQNHD